MSPLCEGCHQRPCECEELEAKQAEPEWAIEPRRFTLYRLNTGRLVGGWNVAGDDGPPDSILGRPVEIVNVVEVGEE